ncbi:MAG: hypothetical protein AMJ90_09605 [candidate division Zixibacteria bacterium SM23_73_2]|nr:MAG: hypothetical protein AMJ90_09605 [candidate division Zixibacteria bacterium SM23_73_2]
MGIIILGSIVLIFLGGILVYNRLINLRNRVENAWHQIDVQLLKRADLIPNLVETVKGYAKHEKEVFEKVTQARASVTQAGTIKQKADATNMLTSALKSLFAVVENYPELKANQNFLLLQEELSGIESKIAYARQFYNDTVMNYNRTQQLFPSNIVASLFGFTLKDYFEIEEPGKREAPRVDFK